MVNEVKVVEIGRSGLNWVFFGWNGSKLVEIIWSWLNFYFFLGYDGYKFVKVVGSRWKWVELVEVSIFIIENGEMSWSKLKLMEIGKLGFTNENNRA